MPLSPTPEQQSIIDFALQSKESLLINALAGSAKTTTLEMLCRALPIQPILSLAFNKRVAEEMVKRLPPHVKVQTLNALGHSIWSGATGKRLTLEFKKSGGALKASIDRLGRSDKTDAWEAYGETLAIIRSAKVQGYIPEGKFENGRRIISAEEFYSGLEEEPSALVKDLVEDVLTRSIVAAYEGRVDFDDQIYMSTLFGGTFPQFPITMVDEAQDLSPLNHVMLERLVGNRRLIAVGDPYQSIYAFRGAASNSMTKLRQTFRMTERGLSISFRCPISVVERARGRAPHMQWPDWAEQGAIHSPSEWSAAEVPDGAAILCRNNAPLYKCAMTLLRAGRGVKLVGADIGPQLLRLLKKLGPEHTQQEQVYGLIDQWRTQQLRKTRSPGAVEDRTECLRVFASWGRDLGEAVAHTEHVFASGGTIQLLSGHKAKGLEWDTVYFMDPWRIPSAYATTNEDKEQERNLEYVITTRAKRELWIVDLETLRS